jgi:hypothetical protein
MLTYIDPHDVPQIVRPLIDKLKDASLSPDNQVAALRALAVLGPPAKDTRDIVMNVIQRAKKNPPEGGPVVVAGDVALGCMKLPEAEGMNVKDPLFQAEVKSLYPGSREGENPPEEKFDDPVHQSR